MQPYVFPYIGYFQLIKSVDLFVFYNDVNFIKKSWINRNRILFNGADHMFTVPCAAVSQNNKICETKLSPDVKQRDKLISTIRQAYKRAPQFNAVSALVEEVFMGSFEYVDEMAMASCEAVAHYLKLTTVFKDIKNKYGNEQLKREERLIDICHREHIAHYINAIGGAEIYEPTYFESRGIFLKFLKPGMVTYPQLNPNFVPWLSIIDVLMFNDQETVVKMLDQYELV